VDGAMSGFGNPGLGLEIIYSFVIIICSLMIYFGTKELYQLSSHKGINYFRRAFLFFAIAYFFRNFIKFILFYFNIARIIEISPKTAGILLGHTTLFIFVYFSSMAIFYLLYSVMWKRWNNSNKVYLFHILAVIISFISILFPSPFIHLTINLGLLVLVIIIVYISRKNQKKNKSKLYFIYLLLMIFWILNVLDILVPEFLRTYQIIIYLASIGIFLLILYKVLKKVGN